MSSSRVEAAAGILEGLQQLLNGSGATEDPARPLSAYDEHLRRFLTPVVLEPGNDVVLEFTDSSGDEEEEEEEEVTSWMEITFGRGGEVMRPVTVTAEELRERKLRQTMAREAAIEKLLTEVAIQGGEGLDCCVCLNEIEEAHEEDEEKARPKRTPCGHIFHGGCIRRWLKLDGSRTCPVCRFQILPADAD